MNRYGLLVLAFVCCLGGPAWAKDYFVRAGGSDSAAGTSAGSAWATMTHAATTARAGDTVYVGAGTYAGNIRFTSAGTAGSPIAFVADVDGRRTGDRGDVVVSHGTSGTAVSITRADYVSLDGFIIKGGQTGVLIDASVGVSLDNVHVAGARERAVQIRNNGKASIADSTISETGLGVDVSNGTAIIDDCLFADLTQDGVNVQNSGSVAEVRRTRFSDVRRGGLASNGDLVMINCIIDGATQEGVYTRNNTKLVMVNCTVNDTAKEGIRFRGTTTLYNNIVSNVGSHAMRLDGGRVTASHTLVFNRKGSRSHRFNSLEYEFDPEYANPSGGDFSLKPSSGAIDLAKDQSGYTRVDFSGKDRPDGKAWDLGAHEGSAIAKEFFVATSGSDGNDGLSNKTPFKTIQHAVNQCTLPGSTVFVAPGTYPERVLIGTGAGANAVSGDDGDPTRIIGDVSGVLTDSAPGKVVLDGRNAQTSAVHVQGVSHWTLEGFTITGYRTYGVYATGGAISLDSCTMLVPRSYGFYCTPTADVSVVGCTFERDNGSGHAIWLWNRSGSYDVAMVVDRNRIVAPVSTLAGGPSPYTRGSYGTGLVRYQYGIIALNYSGIGDSSIKIRNNIVTDCYLPIYAVTNRGGIPTEIVNNTVTRSLYSIYQYDISRTGIVVNNIVSDCYYGLFVPRRIADVQGHVEHGITYDMSAFRYTFMPDDLVTSSPSFTDAEAGDFSLAGGSPAADAGVAYKAPGTDIDGRSRPADGDNDGEPGYDIGAIELVTGATRTRIVRWREISPIGDD